MSGTANKIERVLRRSPEKRGDKRHPLPKVLTDTQTLKTYTARLQEQKNLTGSKALGLLAQAKEQGLIP